MNYKAGDVVVCVYDDSGRSNYIGSVFRISSIGVSTKYPYDSNGPSFSDEEIRKVEVGDQVEWPSSSKSIWRITGIRNKDDISCECVQTGGDSRYRVGQVHNGWNMTSAKVTKKINSKFNVMKTLSTMMKKLLDADTQKLVKVGFINGDLDLTSEGQKALLTVLFVEKKTELVAIADDLIAEEEKAKKS